MTIESMNKCLNRRLLKMSNVARGLTRFLSQHHKLRIDQTEAVNDDLSFDGLDGVHNQGDSSAIESLKGGLCVDISRRKPATKPRMGVIPSYDHFRSSRLLQHVQHFCLKDGIHGLDTHRGTRLRHGKDIYTIDGVIIHKLAQHEAHDFHRNPSPTVLEHFQKCQRRNMDLFGTIWGWGIRSGSAKAAASRHATHKLLQSFHDGLDLVTQQYVDQVVSMNT
mmetsp:Transcript_9898/g.15865  ORF Transcript_9898/g.15865 Transcript_9898/m.15865 type:complete len:221 (+) Transcript_9898:722-1384(+)